MILRLLTVTLCASTLFLLLTGCSKKTEQTPELTDAANDPDDPCPWDTNDSSKNAENLPMDETTSGYICPPGDQDWYEFTVSAGNDLLNVSMTLDAPVSPVEVTYSIWLDNKTTVAAPISGENALPGLPLSITHKLDAKTYFLMARDSGGNVQDTSHPYNIILTASKDLDSHEPNDNQEVSTSIGNDKENIKGYISYRNDEDWYSISLSKRTLLDVHLTMPKGSIEPAYSIINANGDVLASDANAGGTAVPTDLQYRVSIKEDGDYYIVISDDNKLDSDADTPYTLVLSSTPDPDVNESNDHPTEATSFSTSLSCNSDWSKWETKEGYIASSGDVDWYKLNITGCDYAVIEVDLTFDSPDSLPDDFIASARLVRVDADTSCKMDQECQTLTKKCKTNLGCSLFGNTCLASGVCGGAGVCLTGDLCGANLISKSAQPNAPGKVHFAAPLHNWSDPNAIYLVIANGYSNSFSTNHSYSVKARIITEPDPSEMADGYTPKPPTIDEVKTQAKKAIEVPVHNCVAGGDTDGGVMDCCDNGDWIKGFISFNYDQDGFKYRHPCPNNDCIVRILYEFDDGPVDFYLNVYRNGKIWFNNLSNAVDKNHQSAITGAYGGLTDNDECFYAYKGHKGDPFWYNLHIRDTVFVSEKEQTNGTWDWNIGQQYRFCIEKIADGCSEPPCHLYDEGCGLPPDGE